MFNFSKNCLIIQVLLDAKFKMFKLLIMLKYYFNLYPFFQLITLFVCIKTFQKFLYNKKNIKKKYFKYCKRIKLNNNFYNIKPFALYTANKQEVESYNIVLKI